MKALGAGRIFLYLAVVLLLSGETSAPAQRGLALALYLLMGVCSVLLQAIGEAVARRPAENGRRGGWPSRGSIFWGAALVFDVAAQAFVVERAGGATGGFGLLLCLPVLIWGMQQGLAGGSTSAILATAAQIITRGAGGDRIFFDAPAMALLGVFSGLLGRRMQQERELHRATREALVQARLDAGSVIARLSGGLICLDPGGCVTLVNERGRRMLDPFGCFNPEDDLDQIPDEHPLAALARELLDRLRSGIEQSGELQLGQGANAVTLEITTNPIADGAGRPHGMIALFQDLSDRRAREEQRRQKERLALIGELSAGLAHEIRNSLKPLSGSVELLRREMPSGDRTKDALMEIILRESESLENFVTEFLDFARDKKLEMRGLPIERVVGEELPFPAGTTGRERPALGAGGPGRPAPGRAQPRHQRVGGGSRPHRGGVAARGPGGRDFRAGLRAGHTGGGSAPRFRAVFHDEAERHRSGAGHRPGPRAPPGGKADPGAGRRGRCAGVHLPASD